MTESEKQKWKQFDVLYNYCEKKLGHGIQDGNLYLYPCPWRFHSNKMLEIKKLKDGGKFSCWVCDKHGDIFDLVAELSGKSKPSFSEKVELVLNDKDIDEPSSESQEDCKVKQGDPSHSLTRSVKKKAKKVLMTEEEVWQSVQRAAEYSWVMRDYANKLNLPMEILMAHTDINNADRGLLGLNRYRKLLYIYTNRDDSGKLLVHGVKQRADKQKGPRFFWAISPHPQKLFGEQSIKESETVIITEGESDALAVRASLSAWLEYELLENSDGYDEFEKQFSVVAKPSAHIAGEEWALPLQNKSVILCVDNDEAGKEGATQTIELLKTIGVLNVYTWIPPIGKKDARATFCKQKPDELIINIIMNKTKAN